MRLQAKRLPDAVHRRFRYSGLVGNLPDTPVRSGFGFRLQRLANKLWQSLVPNRASAARAELVVGSGHPVSEEPAPPPAYRDLSRVHVPSHFHVPPTISPEQ